MVQQPAPLCSGGDEHSYSSHQIAAAWAWFERNDAACITPRRAEILRISAHPRKTARPPSRFKKEFLASLDLIAHSDKGGNPDCPTSPATIWRPRRRSFHGKSVRHGRTDACESVDITVHCASSRFAALSDQQKHDDVLIVNGHDHGDRIGSSLLDEFELESVWRQMQHHISPSVLSSAIVDCSSSTKSCMYVKAEESINSAAYVEYGQQSPNNASSCRKSGFDAYRRRGGSGHFDHPHRRSPSKDDHRRSGNSPYFLHQLLRLRGGKSASLPALCSSIATADSIRNQHLRHASNQSKAKLHEAKQQDSSSKDNSVDAGSMRSVVRRDKGGEEEELDHHHHLHRHRHRHVHHHHHHHHHAVLQHTGQDHDVLLLEQTMQSHYYIDQKCPS